MWTGKRKFLATFFVVMTIIFTLLSFSSCGGGEEVVNRTFDERVLETEERKGDAVETFELKRRRLMEIDVRGVTLDQSWVWVKVLILDEKDRKVYDWSFDLSYYHGYEGGESWSEGDKDETKAFLLGPGEYKVLVYAEDAKSSDTSAGFGYVRKGYSTIERHERVNVQVRRGITLSRYYILFMLLFGGLSVGYIWLISQTGSSDAGYYDGGYAYDDGYGGGYDEYTEPPREEGQGDPDAIFSAISGAGGAAEEAPPSDVGPAGTHEDEEDEV